MSLKSKGTSVKASHVKPLENRIYLTRIVTFARADVLMIAMVCFYPCHTV